MYDGAEVDLAAGGVGDAVVHVDDQRLPGHRLHLVGACGRGCCTPSGRGPASWPRRRGTPCVMASPPALPVASLRKVTGTVHFSSSAGLAPTPPSPGGVGGMVSGARSGRPASDMPLPPAPPLPPRCHRCCRRSRCRPSRRRCRPSRCRRCRPSKVRRPCRCRCCRPSKARRPCRCRCCRRDQPWPSRRCRRTRRSCRRCHLCRRRAGSHSRRAPPPAGWSGRPTSQRAAWTYGLLCVWEP